jgi:lipid-binding SYLF domain-containing protein
MKVTNETATNMTSPSKLKYAAGLLLAALVLFATDNASAQSLTSKSASALRQLVAQNRAANKVSQNAIAVLVFPEIVKAGFIFGGQGGEGVLFVHGKRAGRYRTFAASYGLQAGVQKFGYALFFLDQRAVDWVNETRGWTIGTGPSVVVVDQGMARTMDTQTLHSGIYAFTFDQKGLMAGLGIQGSKIERIGQ